MRYYVYAYYRPDENTPFYIGKGSGTRATDHLKKAHGRTLFYRELNKLLRRGIAPRIVILKRFRKEKDAYNYERELIFKYGRSQFGSGCLTNFTDGGKRYNVTITAAERLFKELSS